MNGGSTAVGAAQEAPKAVVIKFCLRGLHARVVDLDGEDIGMRPEL